MDGMEQVSTTTGWKQDMLKQIVKMEARLNAALYGNMSIHQRIVFWNSFTLSLFHYRASVTCYDFAQLRPLYQAMSKWILSRKWFPAALLPGLCRFLRIGPLLDPMHMQCVALFGLLYRRNLNLADLSQVPYDNLDPHQQWCLKQWDGLRHEFSPAQISFLYEIHTAPHSTPTSRARTLKAKLTQFRLPRLANDAQAHLITRTLTSGWPHGPQATLLEWLSALPLSRLGHVPRYTILRWALTEDNDVWLATRGILSRTAPCCICGLSGRQYPLGSGHGAVCHSCPPVTQDWTSFALTPNEQSAFSTKFGPRIPETHPAVTRIGLKCQNVTRSVPDTHLIPCVLCQTGYNAIDHWCKFCPILPMVVNALVKSDSWTVPVLDRVINSVVTLVTCHTLFHMRRAIMVAGGLSLIWLRSTAISQYWYR